MGTTGGVRGLAWPPRFKVGAGSRSGGLCKGFRFGSQDLTGEGV